MKKTIHIQKGLGKTEERQISYLPFRFILALLLIILEILQVIAILVLLCIYVPYFYIALWATQIGCVLSIVARKDNPDYKIPWLLFVLVVPIVGFMCYLMFYTRNLSKKQEKALQNIQAITVHKNDTAQFNALAEIDSLAYSQAFCLCQLAQSHLYQKTDVRYFALGDDVVPTLLKDLQEAQSFVFLEYFIIEEGILWNSILEILKEKAKSGVEVRILYDDIGCMSTLPGNYYKLLQKQGFKCVPFGKLKGQANNEFNNRNHRKLTIIDGKIAYTGGMNLADEYVNAIQRFGHWKDVAIRLEGEAVDEFVKLFLCDYQMSDKCENFPLNQYCCAKPTKNDGFCVPFGDGPKPVYEKQVSKTAILNLLNHAKRYVFITSPYLIIDNELVQALENTALRGVDVRIITPHIPDKKLVLMISRSYYAPLIGAGVKIFEYESGFIHAKNFLSDDEIAIIGTMNLDYRSLVHHFENGVWFYRHSFLKELKTDFLQTQEDSLEIGKNQFAGTWFKKFFLAILRIFTPLL